MHRCIVNLLFYTGRTNLIKQSCKVPFAIFQLQQQYMTMLLKRFTLTTLRPFIIVFHHQFESKGTSENGVAKIYDE